MEPYRLNLCAIEGSLREVQRAFPQINELLQSRWDAMTDEVVANMLAGYALVDKMLAEGTNILSPNWVAYLLELNHRVLCGLDARVRLEHRKHIEAVTTRFYYQAGFNIDNILRWYDKHSRESSWKKAAGVYIRILSQPQLYIEGNHRTGALIMSYILAREGNAPFVLTVENARSYFDPSTTVKETKKSTSTLLMKLPRIKKRFAEFLRLQANATYLQPTT
ncbi:MAG: hypothetical protein AB7G75_12945 [Candidatus Binatia bacterium]